VSVRSRGIDVSGRAGRLGHHGQPRQPAGGCEPSARPARSFEPRTSRFFAHDDFIAQASKAPEVADVHEQLVANMYLQVLEVGGELLLWMQGPTAEEPAVVWDVEGVQLTPSSPPMVALQPEAGDLTIFSSKSPHALDSVEGTPRVGTAAFIGVAGEDQPLRF
jgi:hypothetical protein